MISRRSTWLQLLLMLLGCWCSQPAVVFAEDRGPSSPLEEEGKITTRPVGVGYLDLNGYYDTRDAVGLTVNAFATFAHGFSYFSFADYDNKFKPAQRGDTQNFYTEHNLMWGPAATVPLDLHLQWALGEGKLYPVEDAVRAGLRLRANQLPALGAWLERLGTWFQLTWFPYVQGLHFKQVQAYNSQLSLFYRVDALNRVYLSGFADFDFSTGKGDYYLGAITEHQFGIRVVSGLYAVAELRHQYVERPSTGLGVGVEWMMRFQTLATEP